MDLTYRYFSDRPFKVAVLHQGHPPPVIDNIRKPMKPTGYRDSSADIAFALKKRNIQVLTPKSQPNPTIDAQWSFPDTTKGIKRACDLGANTLWLNTVLYDTHPVMNFIEKGLSVIGNHPKCVHEFDDKYHTNTLLKKNKLNTPSELLIGEKEGEGFLNIHNITPVMLERLGVCFPVIIKPIRGRGSQGVKRVESFSQLKRHVKALLDEKIVYQDRIFGKYGDKIIMENYLPGEEITVSVMPPGKYIISNDIFKKKSHWAMPCIRRIGHHQGIAPYNGIVAVTKNSYLLTKEENSSNKYQSILRQCELAAEIIEAKAPIRIDCRFNEQGEGVLFDLNLKPNMTGAGRPNRDDQDGLTTIAARSLNWTYSDLIINMLNQAWIAV